jgi:hypothetical protein
MMLLPSLSSLFAASIIVVTMGIFYVASRLINITYSDILHKDLSKKYLHYHVGLVENVDSMVFMVFHISIAFSVESFTDTKYKKVFGRKSSSSPFQLWVGFLSFSFRSESMNKQEKNEK